MNLQQIASRWNAESPEQLIALASRHIPFWVSLLLVILIGYYLASMAWMLYPEAEQADWTPPAFSGPGNSAAPAPQAGDYTALVNAHLFGTASKEPVPVVEGTIDAPETRLNLKLRGAVSARDDQVAHAIIADGSGKEKVYFLGDAIPGGATLHQIQIDRVILNRGGILEALKLPRDATGARTSTTRSPPARRTTARPTVQELVTQNAAAFTDVVRLQPFSPKGKLRGYKVFPGPKRQYFSSLGLRPGDLVTEINGIVLDNPAKGAQVFQDLGRTTQVTLTIERNGESQVVTVDTSQLENIGGGTR